MESSKPKIACEFPGMIRIYKDGRVQLWRIPIYLHAFSSQKWPIKPNQKLPLIIYFPGGGFCLSSTFTPMYHNYVNAIAAEAKVVVSVKYRLAPENPIPAAYEDARVSLQWVGSHCGNVARPEALPNEHADLERVFLGRVSAGANIAHNLAMAVGEADFGLKEGILGIVLEDSYFWGSMPIGSEALNPNKATVDQLWPFVCPSSPENDDPHVNPVAKGAPSLAGLGCKRVLLWVAEKDVFRDRGWLYYESLGKGGWKGVVEIKETEGEDHAFNLYNLESEKAKNFIKNLAAFYNKDMPPFI